MMRCACDRHKFVAWFVLKFLLAFALGSGKPRRSALINNLWSPTKSALQSASRLRQSRHCMPPEPAAQLRYCMQLQAHDCTGLRQSDFCCKQVQRQQRLLQASQPLVLPTRHLQQPLPVRTPQLSFAYKYKCTHVHVLASAQGCQAVRNSALCCKARFKALRFHTYVCVPVEHHRAAAAVAGSSYYSVPN